MLLFRFINEQFTLDVLKCKVLSRTFRVQAL